MRQIDPLGGFAPLAVKAALGTALLALLGYAVSTLAAPPESDGRVTHTVSGNTETWRIDEPNVKKSIIEFQQIRFQAGDKVRVTGGGCVQTGGWGKTWKRYVDPAPTRTGCTTGWSWSRAPSANCPPTASTVSPAS